MWRIKPFNPIFLKTCLIFLSVSLTFVPICPTCKQTKIPCSTPQCSKAVFSKHRVMLLLSKPQEGLGDGLKPTHTPQGSSYTPVSCEAHVCGRENVEPQHPCCADTTALLLLSPWAGWVRYFCQTCVTRRSGVTPSKIYCFPPAAGAAPPLGVSAGTAAPAPHGPRLRRQHPGTNPSVPASLSAWALPFPGLGTCSIHRVPQCSPPLPWQ